MMQGFYFLVKSGLVLIYILREEILAGRHFGEFVGLTKYSPKSAKISSRQN